MNKLLNLCLRVAGAWRLMWGLCPNCNSDAPELYYCPVCEYKKITGRRELWKRFNELLSPD